MLTHKGTVPIKTERLLLRKFRVDDAQSMFDHWANDARVTRYLTWTPHTSPELTRQLLEDWCASYENADYYNWVIELAGEIIGNISAVRISERDEYAELGYCMGVDYWNHGIMPEAAKAVIDFLFAEVGVNRVEIRHAVKNPASGRVAQKCGLTFEGTKREFFKDASGEFHDVSYYGILRREWEATHAGGMTAAISLEKAVCEDCTQIYEMQIAAFRALLEKYRDYETNPGAEMPERTVLRFNEPETDFWLITLENRHIGAIRICNFGALCKLKQIFILPEYQDRGYAKKAISLVESFYPGASRWELETILQEDKLCHLYETMGYRKTGRTERIKEGMDLVYYAKENA